MNYPEDFIDKIICGDCLELMKDIPSQSIPLIIADPPYGKRQVSWDKFTDDEFSGWINEISRVVTKNGTLYFFGIPEVLSERFLIFKTAFSYVRELVWHYRNASNINHNVWGWNWQKILMCSHQENENLRTFNLDDVRIPYSKNTNTSRVRHDDTTSSYGINKNGRTDGKKKYNDLGRKPIDVFDFPRVTAGVAQQEGVGHPTQKPLKLIRTFVLASSNVGDVILDPFVGSGTTAEACIRTGRHFIGIDISEKYCQIARDRLSQIQLGLIE